MYDPNTVLFALQGRPENVYLWNFVDDSLEQLPFSADQHTLVWDESTKLFYGLEQADNYDASITSAWDMQGKQKWRMVFPTDTSHINYLSVDGTYAYVSFRGTNAIAKVNIATKETEMVVGGSRSTVDVLGIDGVTKMGHKNDDFFWLRQHKGQQLSQRYWSLFDNHVNKDKATFANGDNSHLVVLDVAEDPARVVYYWDTGDKSKIYGSCDVTPAGNVLGTSWPDRVDPNQPDKQYQVNLWEVTPDYQIAWRMGFKGKNPFTPSDTSSPYIHTTTEQDEAPIGWVIYDAERVYPAPTYSIPCRVDGADAISFMAFNSIRTQVGLPGRAYVVQDQTPVQSTDFNFQKAHLPTTVQLSTEGVTGDFILVVVNYWGQSKANTIQLDALPLCSAMPPSGRMFFDQ